MNEMYDVLTEGLKSGYGGKVKPEIVKRGPFDVNSIQVPIENGAYTDNWVEGGGQEIAELNGQRITRVYAGMTVPKVKLEKLGITEGQVTNYLIEKNTMLAGKTRLDEDCLPDPDGDWQYGYTVIHRNEEIGLIISVESITYQDHSVFEHGIMISPAQ